MVVISMLEPLTFDGRAPVIRHHIRPAVERARYRWLAWPALAWRVVTPDPTHERPLDVFQRTVLRLAGAGTHRVDRVAELLDIKPDLAAHLVGGLQAWGYLDHRGELLPPGQRALEEDEEARQAPLVSRYVFQCPYSGQLLGRIAERLEYAETQPASEVGQWPMLRLGSRGKPRVRPIFFVAPRDRDIRCAVPEPEAVLAAFAGHVQGVRDHAAEQDLDWVSAPHATQSPAVLQRVSIVDDRPMPLFLATWIYVPRESGDGRWRVADPFGHGDLYPLRRRITEVARGFAPLADELRRLTGERVDALAAELDTWQSALDGEARAAIESALSAAVVGLPFERNLMEMERALAEFKRRADRKARAETAVLEANKALEQAFRVIVERWRCGRDNVDRLSWKDKSRNAMLLDAIAADIGFETPLPERFSRTRRGNIISAVTHGDAALGRQIGAALLAADAHEDHPLRALAAEIPTALQHIDAMAPERNAAAHARQDETTLTPDALKTHIEHTYAILRVFMARMAWR